jgi:hypothetical protein
MLADPRGLLADFEAALLQCGVANPPAIAHEPWPAPHRPPRFRPGMCAVYVFSLSATAGGRCPAGPHRIIKVGKAGPNSKSRFESQHYNPGSAPSTLAASLLKACPLWSYLGFPANNSAQVGRWLMENTDRDHFYLRAADLEYLGDLERYVRGRHSPVFEGG